MITNPTQNLAFITPRFSEEGTVGGAENLIKSLALYAAERGGRISLLTTCAKSHYTWENERPAGVTSWNGLEVHSFPVDENRDLEIFLDLQTRISNRGTLTPEEEQQWIDHSVNSTALYDYLREKGDEYDAILMGPYLFGLTWHASRIYPGKTFLIPCLHDEPFAYLSLMREMFGSVRGCLFNADPEADLGARLYDITPDRSHVVGMGMEPFEADKETFSRRHKLDRPYILYSGRREPLKGTPLLMEYLELFRDRTGKDLQVVLTGSGDFDVPPGLEGRVLDLGFVDEKEKQDVMAGAVAFCHPSVNESFGIVLMESWLARTPALVHAGSEVLTWQCQRSGGGLWFRSYPEFEEALTCLVEQDVLNRAMGDSGRQFVLDEYAWERVGERFFNALRDTPPLA